MLVASPLLLVSSAWACRYAAYLHPLALSGALSGLVAQREVVVGEIYPRAAYALALANTLPAPPEAIAKTRQDRRATALDRLAASHWIKESNILLPDPRHALGNEDDFDALLCAAAMVRCATSGSPLSCSLIDQRAEGGILATRNVEIPARPWRL